MTRMLSVLFEVESVLPILLEDLEKWNTVDVDYEPPRVERLWTQYKQYRIYLHRIHKCEKALYHPHPWASAIRINKGSYEMGVGFGAGDISPPIAATLCLVAGSAYEMDHIDGWHYVKPITDTTMSLMVTDIPWGRSSPGKDLKFNSLTDEAKAGIVLFFRDYYASPFPVVPAYLSRSSP